MPINFTRGSTTVIFSKGLTYPFGGKMPRFLQVAAETDAANVLYVYDKGILDEYELIFEKIPKADYDALDSFLRNTVIGKKNTFSYTDEEGNVQTVRYIHGFDNFKQVAYHLYSGRILLRKE